MNEMNYKEEMSLMPPNIFDFELFPPTHDTDFEYFVKL